LLQKTLLFLLISLPFFSSAQKPYHFTLGNEALANAEIYDIAQSDDGNYWLATNKGLYGYDGYDFTQISHPKQISYSLFHFKKDNNGLLYCHNLSGQFSY